MSKFQKSISIVIVVVMLASFGASAFAQDDVAATDAEVQAICTAPERPADGERPERGDVLLELGVTQEEIDAAREDGTLRELVEQYADELEALRAEHQAEREAAKLEVLNACLDEAVASGALTADQAEAIRAAQADGTLRDLLQSDEFDGIRLFPRPEGREGHGDNGRSPRGGERGQRGEGRPGAGAENGAPANNGDA